MFQSWHPPNTSELNQCKSLWLGNQQLAPSVSRYSHIFTCEQGIAPCKLGAMGHFIHWRDGHVRALPWARLPAPLSGRRLSDIPGREWEGHDPVPHCAVSTVFEDRPSRGIFHSGWRCGGHNQRRDYWRTLDESRATVATWIFA